jgi:hypothetical protein
VFELAVNSTGGDQFGADIDPAARLNVLAAQRTQGESAAGQRLEQQRTYVGLLLVAAGEVKAVRGLDLGRDIDRKPFDPARDGPQHEVGDHHNDRARGFDAVA